MKFKTKLFGGLGSIILIFIILLVILLNMINQINVSMSVVVGGLTERMKLASTAQYEINNMGRQLREISSNPPQDMYQQIINDWEQSRINIETTIESLREKDSRKQSQQLITKFMTLYSTYEDVGQEIITAYQTNNKTDYNNVLWKEIRQNRERMQQIMDLIYTLQEQEMKDELFRTRESYYSAVRTIYSFVAISIIIGLGIIILFINRMTKNLNRVTSVITNTAYHQGTQFPRIDINSKDEIGTIAKAYNKLAKVLEESIMQEKELKEKAEENGWLKSKVAEITSKYPSAEDFPTLAQLFLSSITPMVGAEYGTFYIKKGDVENRKYKRVASFAFAEDQMKYESFKLGEGLIGQCAVEKKPILLTEIPKDYIKIVSGTGETSPKNIYIIPAEFEGEVLGIMEVASVTPFTPLQQKLMEEVMEHLGITLNSIGNRIRVKKLLQDSQAFTEELQSQSEELQLQQEELRTTNEKLEEQYRNSEQKKKELEEIGIMLEEKAHQLALSSQYKSEFLANMSHELRTPLNSLLILAQMLTEKGGENLTPKQVEYIRTIYSSGNDLLHLINDILDLSKVESGKIEVIPEEVYLEDIKNSAENQFLPIARKKGIKFNVMLAPDLPKQFYTDEHRLNQVLKNLLSNAFKFTEKGSVTLIIDNETKIIPDAQNPSEMHEDMIKFSVMDTGIGIPKQHQHMIFEAFKQADGTTSRKYGGTGLGLSISKEIAQLLGGFIEVSSDVGVGSCFTLYIPNYRTNLKDVEPLSMTEAAVSIMNDEISMSSDDISSGIKDTDGITMKGSPLISGKKILIVDDDIRNIFALTAALEENEMEVVFAKNGREGIEVLQENPDTDLILMDIMMPEMDGFEAMRKIRRIHEFQNLPIIALTAKAMKHNREECIEAGASDYISKPINLEQLLSLMHVWLYR